MLENFTANIINFSVIFNSQPVRAFSYNTPGKEPQLLHMSL